MSLIFCSVTSWTIELQDVCITKLFNLDLSVLMSQLFSMWLIRISQNILNESQLFDSERHVFDVFIPGLLGDPVKRKAVVADKVRTEKDIKSILSLEGVILNLYHSLCVQMVEIIFQLAEHALKRCPEQGKIHVMEQHFHVS